MSSFAFAEDSITNQLSVFAPTHPVHLSVHPKLTTQAQLPMLLQEKYAAFDHQKTGVDIVQDGPQLTRRRKISICQGIIFKLKIFFQYSHEIQS